MSSLHTAIPTPSFYSFWHGHPYIPIHFLKMFYILVYKQTWACDITVAKVEFMVPLKYLLKLIVILSNLVVCGMLGMF